MNTLGPRAVEAEITLYFDYSIMTSYEQMDWIEKEFGGRIKDLEEIRDGHGYLKQFKVVVAAALSGQATLEGVKVGTIGHVHPSKSNLSSVLSALLPASTEPVAYTECLATLTRIQAAALDENGDTDFYEEASAGIKKIKALRASPPASGAVEALRRCLLPIWMGLAEAEMLGEPIPDDAVVLSFMGSGASDRVTAGEVRSALSSAPAGEVRADGGCLYCDADQGEVHRPNCQRPASPREGR